MLVPIQIDTSSLVAQFDLEPDAIEKLMDNCVKGVAADYADKLEEVVLRSLHSSRQIYAQAIRVIDTGRLMGRVMVDYSNPIVKSLEEGSGAYDMKEGFLASSKASTGKDGKKYMSIPFRWATPTAVADSLVFSNKMPEAVYKEAKKLDNRQSLVMGNTSLPEQYKSIKTRPEIQDSEGKKRFEQYTHKSSIYEGIQKITDNVTGQSRYMSFRRVSEKSSPEAFIHPGFRAGNFTQLALQEFDIARSLEVQIDNELVKLGFGD